MRILAALVVYGVAVAAHATITYTYSYTGQPYSKGKIANFTPPCGAGSCANYSGTMSITGSFTTAAPLPPNLPSRTDIPGLVTSYSFTDGINLFSSTDPNSRRYEVRAQTDSSGNIVASGMDISLERWQTGSSPHAVNDRFANVGIGFGHDSAINNAPCSEIASPPPSPPVDSDSCAGFRTDESHSSATGGSSGTWSITSSFSGSTATGTGIATASLTCTGTASCAYTRAAWIAPPGGAGAPPVDATIAGVAFPQGLFDFAIVGSSPGFTATITLTFPQPVPVGTVYFKYGPTAATPAPHWYQLPAIIAGNTIMFSITDGGLGDDDLTANGTIVDQGGPGLLTTPPPSASSINLIEYYHEAFDHYFITYAADEIAKLDNGTFKGWVRTGLSFMAFATTQGGTSAVCRIYIPPGKGDGHFFGRDANECGGTMAKNPTFILESSTFFYLYPPALGNCATGQVPVYRVFSNRVDANHRYTTNRAVRDQMVSKGWLAEGDGADIVVMCAPQ